jgi:hypothetical protein
MDWADYVALRAVIVVIMILFCYKCGVTPGVERLQTGACGVVVVVVSGGVTGSEMGRGIC